MIRLDCPGDFKSTEQWLRKFNTKRLISKLSKYGEMGVSALREATPKDTGLTAASWGYELEFSDNRAEIHWINTNFNHYVNIAIILQYGHGTGTGGWVEGRDYINPAMRPVFDKIAESAWKEVVIDHV